MENDDDFEEEASPFDRNYVGLVYSPYDKYWEPTGPNGTLKRVPWNKYTEKEIANFLGIVYKKFTYIATFGMGTACKVFSLILLEIPRKSYAFNNGNPFLQQTHLNGMQATKLRLSLK